MVDNPYLNRLQRLHAPERVPQLPAEKPFKPGPWPATEHFEVGQIVATPDGPQTVVWVDSPNSLFPNGQVQLRDARGTVAGWEPAVLLRQADAPALADTYRETWTRDPRPEVGEYTAQWGSLLGLAYDVDGSQHDGLFGLLHGARCWGADLEWTGKGWRLVAGECEPEEWTEIKAKLGPHVVTIRDLLRQVRTE